MGVTAFSRSGRATAGLNAVQEGEHALPEQRRGALVVAGQAAVGEQVLIAGVQEQLRALGGLDQIAGRVEIALADEELVGVHAVNLDWHAVGPWSAELRSRDAGVKQ